jgi:hypothetical protein
MYPQNSFCCIFDRDMAIRLTYVKTYGDHLFAVCFYIRKPHCHISIKTTAKRNLVIHNTWIRLRWTRGLVGRKTKIVLWLTSLFISLLAVCFYIRRSHSHISRSKIQNHATGWKMTDRFYDAEYEVSQPGG